MAKRFTDSSKWGKEWYTDLPVKMKLVWNYLCDTCDHAGVWDINMKLMTFHIGEKVDLKEVTAAFGSRVEVFGKKLLIVDFAKFQYGELTSGNNVHKSVLKRLDEVKSSRTLAKPLRKTKAGPLQGPQDKDQDQDKDLVKEDPSNKDLRKNEDPTHPLITIWNASCGALPKAIKTNPHREKQMAKVWPMISAEEWELVARAIANNAWCNGKNDRGWRADFDYFIQDKTFTKALEGRYDERRPLRASGEMRVVDL